MTEKLEIRTAGEHLPYEERLRKAGQILNGSDLTLREKLFVLTAAISKMFPNAYIRQELSLTEEDLNRNLKRVLSQKELLGTYQRVVLSLKANKHLNGNSNTGKKYRVDYQNSWNGNEIKVDNKTKMITILLEHQSNFPDIPINMAGIGEKLGVTRQRVGQIWNELEKKKLIPAGVHKRQWKP